MSELFGSFGGFSASIGIKRGVALLICSALIISFVSCGKDKKNHPDSSKTQNTDTIKDGQNGKDDTVSIIEFEDSDDDDVVTTTTTTNTTKSKTTKTSKKTTATSKTTATTKAAAPKRDNSYKVTAKKYSSDDGNITYFYPIITGLYDQDMQNFYNKLFKSDFNKAINQSGLSSLKTEYEVTLKTKDKLSIVFRGNQYYEDAAYPYSFAYAYTIDLATGETVVPSRSITIDKAVDAILDDKWTLVRGMDGVSKSDFIEYYNQYDEKQLEDILTEKNVFSVKRNSNSDYYTEGSTACSSYLNENSEPVVILSVNHALGDYAEVHLG